VVSLHEVFVSAHVTAADSLDELALLQSPALPGAIYALY
jgi:hypothetical protein